MPDNLYAMDLTSTKELYRTYKDHPVITTDSRAISPGSIFFALKGANFNGNAFAKQALDQGAAFAVVDEPEVIEGANFLLVEDVLSSLQALARYHRRKFSIPIIGITGSNGKTTTKELVAAVLGSHYKIHYTRGNYNNHIGVPLTLLSMPLDTDVAVIEMGANHQGEIDFLSRIAEPSHGLITNIGKAHLEGFGGIEGVKKGKSELYRFLEETKGMAFINKDASFLTELAAGLSKKVFYRRSKQPARDVADLEVKQLESESFLKVAFLDRNTQSLISIQTQLHGSYNLDNIMTAIALGKYFKVPGAKIKEAIESYIPTNNRSQLIKYKGNDIIMDAYNANPTSMKEAILALSQMNVGSKAAILGDMLELGKDSEIEHKKIAQLALQQNYNWLALVGKEFKACSTHPGVSYFTDVDALKKWFDQQNFKGQQILIKGSRAICLEKLIQS